MKKNNINVKEKIKQMSKEWQRTFDSITDIIFIQDNDFTVIKTNKACLDALGLQREDVIGKKCYKILHKSNRPWPNCPFEKTRKDEKIHTEEVGDPNIAMPLLITSSPIFDDDRKFIGCVHIAKDITAQKKAEKVLKDAKDELEIQAWGLRKTNEAIRILYKELESKNIKLRKLDQLKSDFISTVSHELRTPLTITKEGISLILDEVLGKVNQEQRRFLGVALENLNRLTRVINDLLDISKIESGKIELNKRPIDIKTFMEQLTSSFEIKFKQKGLELRTSIPDETIDIYVDSDKINQVFTNLIYNALKFTQHGSIEILVKDKEDEVECTVADTGRGISEENLPRVFDKFQQFDRTYGPGDKGTGLGLPITKAIIEIHNGIIWVESKLGKGTRFIFTLPKYTPRVLFREHVNNGIKEAIDKRSKMCLIIVSIKLSDKSRSKFSDKKIEDVLEDIANIFKDNFRRAGDMVFKGPNMVGISLTECDKNGGFKVKTRSEKILKAYLTNKKITDMIEVRLGYTIYPDEASSSEELIEKSICK
ncbi:ATP-binding protein [Candidatus Omnitrophota bacterium]